MSAAIDLNLIKQLREESGAGIADCKKALAESNGDYAGAMDFLKKKGIASAQKKSSRVAAEGFIAVHNIAENSAFAVEVNCETDFVSRGEKFHELVGTVVKTAASSKAKDAESLKAQNAGGKTLAEVVTDNVAVIGENLNVRRIATLEVDKGFVVSYVHNASALNKSFGQIAVLVAFSCDKVCDACKEIGKKVAMHVAAMSPVALDASAVPAELVAKEKEIFSEQARASGKPDNIIEKMVEGRIKKFYQESVLLEQAFVMDNKQSVGEFVTSSAKQIGCNMQVKSFVRLQLGEGIEKNTSDFAAEVNSIAKKA